MHTGEVRIQKRDVRKEAGGDAFKPSRGFDHLTQECPLSEQKSGDRKVSATDMRQGAGGPGVSSPAPMPRKLRHMAYLTPPPSSQ